MGQSMTGENDHQDWLRESLNEDEEDKILYQTLLEYSWSIRKLRNSFRREIFLQVKKMFAGYYCSTCSRSISQREYLVDVISPHGDLVILRIYKAMQIWNCNFICFPSLLAQATMHQVGYKFSFLFHTISTFGISVVVYKIRMLSYIDFLLEIFKHCHWFAK